MVLLAAPLQKVSINSYTWMNSWFDITSLDPKEFGYNYNDIISSSKLVQDYIDKEYE